MSIDRARAHLAACGLADRIIELDTSSATVALAAVALGTEESRIAKTLSFAVGDRAVLIVVAGDARIDNRAFRERFGCKARMLEADRLETVIGHTAGGVCPFGIEEGVEVYLDGSLRRFDTVYPAAGNAASAVRLTIAELERASGYTAWVEVTRPGEGK